MFFTISQRTHCGRLFFRRTRFAYCVLRPRRVHRISNDGTSKLKTIKANSWRCARMHPMPNNLAAQICTRAHSQKPRRWTQKHAHMRVNKKKTHFCMRKHGRMATAICARKHICFNCARYYHAIPSDRTQRTQIADAEAAKKPSQHHPDQRAKCVMRLTSGVPPGKLHGVLPWRTNVLEPPADPRIWSHVHPNEHERMREKNAGQFARATFERPSQSARKVEHDWCAEFGIVDNSNDWNESKVVVDCWSEITCLDIWRTNGANGDGMSISEFHVVILNS